MDSTVPAVQLLEDLAPEALTVKSGYKTTEFWLQVLTIIATWAASTYVNTQWGYIAAGALSVLSALGYTYSRTVIKKG